MTRLEPQAVFDCFAQVNQVPRPSKREEKMIAFLRQFGEGLGLETEVDETGNVAIRKAATPGYENRKTVILQSHMDMVCEKNKDMDFDFEHDAIQTYVEAQGFSLVRDFVGHGVGANLHEDPEVPNFGRPGHGVRLQPGMTLAIEPMVNVGVYEVNVMSDGWTVKTKDGKLSAHYENSVAITEGDPVILTLPEDGENW